MPETSQSPSEHVTVAADTVTTDLRQALQRDDMVARVQLRADGRHRAPYPGSADRQR